ncbi:MAG: MFS transporter [Pseudomonadota bacterium]
MSDAAASAAAPAEPVEPRVQPVSASYRRYGIGLLFLVYVFNFLDRQIVTILAEPIKQDLGIADWQLGLMTGTAFAVFYCTLGIPIARLAERRNRPWIIGLSLAAWSAFTALCGLAASFWQLVLARIGVGVGEAGCSPPAHSLIADYTPKEQRASAMAFYLMGNPIGALLGVVIGGLVADAYGWRTAFLLVGLPGIVLAVVVVLTLIEPRPKTALAAARQPDGQHQASFTEVLRVLLGKRTFVLMASAISIVAFIGYGHAPFGASFFLRVHGEEIAELAAQFGLGPIGFVGLSLGLILGLAAGLGVFLGGVIGDRFGNRDVSSYMSIPGIAVLLTVPLYTVAMLLPTFLPILPLLALNSVLVSLWQGPVYATVQNVAPIHMRATAASIFLFIVNLVGLGLGPLAVGLVSDILAGPFGMGSAEGVRWALIGSQFLAIPAFVCFWLARKTIREEMEE